MDDQTFQLGVQVSLISLGDFEKIKSAFAKFMRWRHDEEITAEEFGDDLFLTSYITADSGEDAEENLEVIAKGIWETVGEYLPITFQLAPVSGEADEEENSGGLIEFDEADYEDIMREV